MSGKKKTTSKAKEMEKLPKKELLRVDEVASYFDVTTKTIYLWIEHGKLEAEKLGGVWRIPQEAIERFRLVGKEKFFNKYA